MGSGGGIHLESALKKLQFIEETFYNEDSSFIQNTLDVGYKIESPLIKENEYLKKQINILKNKDNERK